MNKTHSILIIAFTFLNSCKSNGPEANLLIGSWNLTELKLESDGIWKEVNADIKLNAIFGHNGSLGTNATTPFGGGWCNVAERYTLADSLIHFEFGAAKCIPLIDPQVPSEAKIIELSGEILLIQWGKNSLKFIRL